MKVLSVSRVYLSSDSGTPLRIKFLLRGLQADPDIDLSVVASGETSEFPNYIQWSPSTFNLLWKLWKQNRIERPDVIVVHCANALKFGIILRVLLGAKFLVLEMHGFVEEENFLSGRISKWKYFYYKLVNGFLYTFPNLITTCSDTASEFLRKYNKNVTTVYGGASVDLFHPQVIKSPRVVNELGTIRVGYAGNARMWQGLPFLLKAFEVLAKDHPKYRLTILLSDNTPLPPAPWLTVLGAVPYAEVPSVLAGCDILVIPREKNRVNDLSFPSKLMEYLAMGKPIIVSDTADMAKIVNSGQNGLVFEPGNITDFLSSLNALKDLDLAKRLGYYARITAVEKYSWTQQSNLFCRLIKNIP